MPRKLLFLVVIVIGFVSCKTNQIVNHNRVGKWITVDTLDEIYTIKGRYRKGNEVGTWKPQLPRESFAWHILRYN